MIGIRAKGQQESEQQERFSPTEEDRSVLPRKVTGAGVSEHDFRANVKDCNNKGRTAWGYVVWCEKAPSR